MDCLGESREELKVRRVRKVVEGQNYGYQDFQEHGVCKMIHVAVSTQAAEGRGRDWP